MWIGVLICALSVPALSAADRYIYRESAPVIEKHGLQSVLPPCSHAGGYKVGGVTSALIQSQGQARIVNQKTQYTSEHNLETAASGYSAQSHVPAPANHIGVDVGSKKAVFQGSTNAFASGQGYVQNSISTNLPKPPISYIPVSQKPHPLSAQSHSHSVGSHQANLHNYNQGLASQNIKQQSHVPAAYPVTPRPVAAGPGSPVSGPPSASHYSPAHGGQHASQHFGGQLSNAQYGTQLSSSNFGGQHSASNLAGQQSTANFGGQHTGSNFGAAQSTQNFVSQQTVSNFGNQHSTSNFAGQQIASDLDNLHTASNFAGQQTAANFGNQNIASNFGGQYHSTNIGQQTASSDYVSQIAASNFAGQHTGVFAGFSSSSLGANGLNGQLGHVIRETVANAPLDPSADKHIYVHIPPDDLESENQATAVAPQYDVAPKKHYKIVFIKAPTHASPNYGQLAAAASPKVEEKTLIYVLVKKPDQPSLEELQQLQQSSFKTSKPEVYFIKYKTQKEGDATQNSAYASSGSALASNQIDITTNSPTADIDIRSGDVVTEAPKHELYGVPIQ